MGHCPAPSILCGANGFNPGPMAIMVDQLVESKLDYSLLQLGHVRFISEQGLSQIAKRLDSPKRMRLPGQKRKKETGYFEKNARALAIKAKDLAAELKDKVISILFRDADGTVSMRRGIYQEKWESIMRGFTMEKYPNGVPMIPMPKSEAWLLCATKSQPYDHCATLEHASGNDRSPNSLKQQLDTAMGHHASAQELVEMVASRKINVDRIGMPSFSKFKRRLFEVLAA